jgi:hypothetical protein
MTTIEMAFWAWVDRRLTEPDTAGMSEQAFLDTVKTPGWIGMRARTAKVKDSESAHFLDRKMAAANDSY